MMDMPTPCEICNEIVEFNTLRQCDNCGRWFCPQCQNEEETWLCKECENTEEE